MVNIDWYRPTGSERQSTFHGMQWTTLSQNYCWIYVCERGYASMSFGSMIHSIVNIQIGIRSLNHIGASGYNVAVAAADFRSSKSKQIEYQNMSDVSSLDYINVFTSLYMKLMNCKKRRKNCRSCCIFVLFSAQFSSAVCVCSFKCIVCTFFISLKIVTWIATLSLWLTPSLQCSYVWARRHRFITTE